MTLTEKNEGENYIMFTLLSHISKYPLPVLLRMAKDNDHDLLI